MTTFNEFIGSTNIYSEVGSFGQWQFDLQPYNGYHI